MISLYLVITTFRKAIFKPYTMCNHTSYGALDQLLIIVKAPLHNSYMLLICIRHVDLDRPPVRRLRATSHHPCVARPSAGSAGSYFLTSYHLTFLPSAPQRIIHNT